jgi:hypothetical protein
MMNGEKNSPESRRVRSLLLTAAGAGIALWAALVTGMLDPVVGVPNNPPILQAMRKEAHWTLLFVLVSAGTLLALRANRDWLARWTLVLPALFFIDMFVFGADQNTSSTNPSDYFHRTDPIVRFIRSDMKNDLFRVNTRNQYGMVMDRNQGMVNRIFTMEGYTPLVLQRAIPPYNDTRKFDLLNVKYRTSFDRQTGTLSLAPNPTYMPRAYFLYDVRVARTEEELAAAFRDSTWNHTTTAILEQDSPLHAALPAGGGHGSARVTAYEDNRLEIEATSPTEGIMVLSEVYYPGWKAFVDGAETEIMRTDYFLRGIAFPGGSHHVEFRFTPPPFVTGAWITAAALVVCLAGLVTFPPRRKRPQEEGR